jgi:NADH-quinone oxidoreductase subunit J
LALMTGGCAVLVVVSQNIVRAATWLLFALGGTSGLFFLLGADFVGATQLLVYVGGTLVLVIFGVMLTAQGPFVTMKTSAAEWALSGIVGILLLTALVVSSLAVGKPDARVAPLVKKYAPPHVLAQDLKPQADGEPETVRRAEQQRLIVARAQSTDVIGQGFLGLGVGPARKEYKTSSADPRREATIVRTHYFLPFLIVSVHLLVVLIGAAYLARAKRRRGATT